ncbi:MAG TPA: cyclase family protein [Anaerolineae bacterium]
MNDKSVHEPEAHVMSVEDVVRDVQGLAAVLQRDSMQMENSKSSRLIDVSHTVEHGMITYKGLPAPIICDYLSREESRRHYAPGTEFHIGKIEMVANTGTYVDAPFHRYADGKDLAQLPLASLANLETVVVRAEAGQRAVGLSHFEDLDVAGKAVLVHTGWSRHWKTEQYFEGHPFLTEEAAEFLRDAGAVMIGIDSLNIDDTVDLARPVHSTLLAAEIPIVEHLTNLDQLPDSGFRFFAVPVKVKAFGTFPVRAFGILPSRI